MGLKAAALCREGLNADAFCVILDAHTTIFQAKPGMTEEEAEEAYYKKHPPGSMQKACDEEGACSTGEISDCLICEYHSETEQRIASMLYDYHDKSKRSLTWTEVIGDDKQKSCKGFICENLQRIIQSKKGIDEPGLNRIREVLNLSEEDTYIRMGRAAVMAFARLGYLVFVASGHPELVPESCRKMDFSVPNYVK